MKGSGSVPRGPPRPDVRTIDPLGEPNLSPIYPIGLRKGGLQIVIGMGPGTPVVFTFRILVHVNDLGHGGQGPSVAGVAVGGDLLGIGIAVPIVVQIDVVGQTVFVRILVDVKKVHPKRFFKRGIELVGHPDPHGIGIGMSLVIKRRRRAESSIRFEAEKMVVVVSVPGNQAVDVSKDLVGLEEVGGKWCTALSI